MSIEIPGYKIIRAIGRGGMATVYLAEQEIFEREVALKVMSKSLAEDPSFGQRFFREAKIVSQLVHPNIVTVHDVGEYQGHFYLSMEYIDGGDLKNARKRLTFRQKITAIKDIAKALQYAATKGYVHRDIKPENIMFHLSDGRAVLTDFGIARAAEAELSVTQTGVAIGTPHYMSPEQAKGQQVDGRADIYSLGVVLYLLLAGKVPFNADSAVAIGIKHITEPIPLLPMELNRLQPLIDKMMAKVPDKRFQNAASLVNAVDKLDMDLVEQHAREFDRKQRELERQQDVESETPTILSAQVKAVSSPSMTPAAAGSPNVASRSGEQPAIEEAEDDDLESTDFNEAISNQEKERFTVIYDNEELADLDSGGSWIGAWLVGILIIGAFGGSIYFYLNPGEWDKLIEQGQQAFNQATDKVQEPTRPVQNSDKLVEEKANAEIEISEEATAQVEEPQTLEGEQDSSEYQIAGEQGVEEFASEDQEGEAEANAEELLLAELEEMRARIASIEEAFSEDAAFLPDLVSAHNELLELAPENESSVQALDVLKENEKEKISQLLAEEKFTVASKKLSQLKSLFTNVDPAEISKLSARLEREQEVSRLLTQAQKAFSANNLTRPRGSSALDIYKQVLRVESGNSDAAKGIRKVSNYYLNQAADAFDKKDIKAAEAKVKVALEVDWKNAKAEKLLESIRNWQESEAQRDLYFGRAEQALAGNKYFEPSKDNAYHFYASILEQEPQSSRARKGIESTKEAFSVWLWGLVGENRFSEAEKALLIPLNILPQDERLQSLAKAIRAVIAERNIANKAAVTKLLVSGKVINDLKGVQSESIDVSRSIYVAFSFKNVASNEGPIEAKLLDGAGNIEVAKAVIPVSPGSNAARFKFDSPVGSFPKGLYTLVLTVKGSILTSIVFAVE